MTKNVAVFTAWVMSMAAAVSAQGLPATPMPNKIAILNIQASILATKDGQKAAADLTAKFNPRKSELEKDQSELTGLQDQLRKGSATMSDEAKAKLERDIDSRTRALNRKAEDLNTEVDQEQSRLMQEIWAKMNEIVTRYSQQNGYAVVLDVSNPQTGVVWAAAEVNITPEIVKLYDQAHAGTETAKPAAMPPTAAAPKPAGPPAAPKK